MKKYKWNYKKFLKNITIIAIITILSIIYLKLFGEALKTSTNSIHTEYQNYIEAEGLENTQENYQEFLKIYNNK